MFKIRSVRFIILLLLIASSTAAQKVKYKDIFPLLNTKQYDQAEPFLRNYLKTTTDNANAYLFMGEIYLKKTESDDILLNTERSILHMDSTIFLFEQTLKLMDEKELRQNKEYYMAYNRRNMRTGEFTVTLSDIRYDLETKITAMRERIDKVKMVKYYFSASSTLYSKSSDLFLVIQKSFPGERELYLRSTDDIIKDLSSLSHKFDSSADMFEHYKSSLNNLGKTKYKQTWNSQPIVSFKEDGKTIPDFYQDDLKVWDYKKFADKALNVIEKEVKPTQDNLVKYDIEINKLRLKLETDSLSVKSELIKLAEKMPDSQLKKFDPDPLPMDIFALKIADLAYKSTLVENKTLKDTSDVYLRLNATKSEVTYLHKMDSLITKLGSRNLDEDIINYQQFVNNTFSKGDIFKSYIRSLKDHTDHEKANKERELAFRTESLKWLIVNNDSIPLTNDVMKSKYWPLVVLQDKYTAGLAFTDSISNQGYFYSITPSRKPDVKVTFPIDKTSLKDRKQNAVKAFVTSDPEGHVFFIVIYLERMVNGKHPATVAKIYKSDGLSWSHSFGFDFVPQELAYIPDTGELVIKSSGDSYISVDKNGKLLLK